MLFDGATIGISSLSVQKKQMKYRILTVLLFLTLSLKAQINRLEFAAGFHASTASQYLLDNADNAFGSQSYSQVRASMAQPL